MKEVSRTEKIIIILYCVSIFCNVYFFMMWSTYNHLISLLLTVLSYIGPMLLLGYVIISHNISIRVSVKGISVLAVFLILMIHMNFLGVRKTQFFSVSDIRLIICVSVLVLVNNRIRSEIFDYSLKIFAIICLPSIVYFILNNIGIRIPYSVLNTAHEGKAIRGVYYQHYPLGLLIASPFTLTRPCGVFDEPGVMGTLAAIFFAGNRNGRKWSIILLVDGFFSLSMAFYVMIIIYFIVKAATKGLIKISVVLMVLFIGLNIFINIDFNNEAISKVQSRIDLSSRFLVVDDRTTDVLDNEFDQFLYDGGLPLIIGNGRFAYQDNPRMSMGYSYKMFIYDHGVFGFILYIAFFILTYYYVGFSLSSLPFVLVFLASIYQRPYVLDIEYYSIYIGAISCFLMEKDYSTNSDIYNSSKKKKRIRISYSGRRLNA